MKKILYVLGILFVALSFTNCSKSALSDLELEDPSLIKVSVQIAQDLHNQKEVQIFIRDSHNRPVELYNGWVEVNGVEARWDRAEINSFNERGYIFYPDDYEHEFRVEIHLNPYDVYWFDLNPETGFPGFVHNYPLMPGESHPDDDPFFGDSYSLYHMPFYDRKVNIGYHILRR